MSGEKNWLAEAQRMAQAGDPRAMALFAQHRDEAMRMLFGGVTGASGAAQGGSLMERDTREAAAIVAKWSVYALPLTEDVKEITVDISQWGETPLVTARTEGGEVVLFDTTEASRANEAHLEDCRHVEASWGDWQDEPGFFDLFCDALTAELTARGLPAPRYLRRDA